MQAAVPTARATVWESDEQLTLDSFIESLMAEPVPLSSSLVPGALAKGFGLSCDSTTTSFGRDLALGFPSSGRQPLRAEALQDALAATTAQRQRNGSAGGARAQHPGSGAPQPAAQLAARAPASVVKAAAAAEDAAGVQGSGGQQEGPEPSAAGQPSFGAALFSSQQPSFGVGAQPGGTFGQQQGLSAQGLGMPPMQSQPLFSQPPPEQPQQQQQQGQTSADAAAAGLQYQQEMAAAAFQQQQAAAAMYQQQAAAYQQQAVAAYQQQFQQQQHQQQQQQSMYGGTNPYAAQMQYGGWNPYTQCNPYFNPYGGGMPFGGMPGGGMPGGMPNMSYPVPQQMPGMLASGATGAAPTAQPQEVVQSDSQNDDDDTKPLKRARLIWTPALHNRFLDAVNKCGGLDKALPKLVMQEMHVNGLTRENVASHLQKYRLRVKKDNEGVKEEDGGTPLFGTLPAGSTPRAADVAEGGGGGGRAPKRSRQQGGDQEVDSTYSADFGGGGGGGAAVSPRRARRAPLGQQEDVDAANNGEGARGKRIAARHGRTPPAPLSETSDGRTAEES